MILSLPKLFAVFATTALFFSSVMLSSARSFRGFDNGTEITREVHAPKSSLIKFDYHSYCHSCYSDPRERKSCIDERSHCLKKMKAPCSTLRKAGLNPLFEFARRPYHGPLYCEGMRVLQDKTSNPCLFLSGDISMIYVSAFETEFIRGLMEAHVDVEHNVVSVREYRPRYSDKKLSERRITPQNEFTGLDVEAMPLEGDPIHIEG